MHRLKVMIAIIFKACIAAHAIPRSHAIGLLAVQRASIRTVVACILALIKEAVGHCMIHYTLSLSPDKATALRDKSIRILLFV